MKLKILNIVSQQNSPKSLKITDNINNYYPCTKLKLNKIK